MPRCVYLAGPITGSTYDEAVDWREALTNKICDMNRLLTADCRWVPLSPMRAKEAFRMPGPLPSTFDEGKAAVQRDLFDIRRSEVVLVNLLDADRVSIGTMCEMGYAHALGKFVLTIAFNWHPGPNVHDHVFVNELSSQVVTTMQEAVNALRYL